MRTWPALKFRKASRNSRDALPALLGKDQTGRPHLVHEELGGGLALRKGNWKFIPMQGTHDGLGPWQRAALGENGALFDLSSDPGETRDLAEENPAKLAELRDLLESIRQGPDR